MYLFFCWCWNTDFGHLHTLKETPGLYSKFVYHEWKTRAWHAFFLSRFNLLDLNLRLNNMFFRENLKFHIFFNLLVFATKNFFYIFGRIIQSFCWKFIIFLLKFNIQIEYIFLYWLENQFWLEIKFLCKKSN